MKPIEEHKLYLTDRHTWAKHVAPNWARMLAKSDETEKRRLWRIAGPELKAEIRELRQQSQA